MLGQGGRIGPGGHAASRRAARRSRPAPARRRPRPSPRPAVLTPSAVLPLPPSLPPPSQPLVVGQVGAGHHAQRAGGDRGQVGHALGVGGVGVQQFRRQHPLGQVVHPPPAGPARADHLAGVEQPLDGDLGLRPVPPGPPVLGPAQLGRGQRALGPEPGQDLVADLLGDLVPAHAPGREAPVAGTRSRAIPRSAGCRPRATSTRTRWPGADASRPARSAPAGPARGGRRRRARASGPAR